jgi:hypothetical protein
MCARRRRHRAGAPRPASLYVFAILDAPIAPPRIAGARIEIVESGKFFVAGEWRRASPVLSERMLRRQHAIVIRIGLAADAVLPVRFGTLVPESELDALLAARARVLRRAFRAVRGRVQMTIRCFGPPLARAAAAALLSGRKYLLARAASGRPVLPPAAAAVRAAVRSLADAEKIDAGRGGVQVSLHHLVRRDRAVRYAERVDAAVSACDPSVRVTLSGPWPPFAFTPDLWDAD